MKSYNLVSAALGALLVLGTVGGTQTAAKADSGSTAAIVGGALIAGALLYDANNRPYYVQNNRRYYVTQSEAQSYRAHHHGVMRQAYVPEQEYPVARDPYHGNNGRHH
jgi:hypothetical protein